MYLIDVIAFAQEYGLPAIIISVSVAVACLIIDKFFADKMCLTVKTYAPFIISVALNFIVDALFLKNGLTFWEDTVYSGILCGSVATAIFACFKKAGKDVKRLIEKPNLNSVIEEYLSGYVDNSDAPEVAAKIVEYIAAKKGDNIDEKDVAEIISKRSDGKCSDGEIKALAALIVKSAQSLLSLSDKDGK